MAGCPLDCSGHGTCDKTSQKCQCYEEWKGDGCNVPICPGDNCGPHGTCSLSNHRKGCNCNHRYRGMCTTLVIILKLNLIVLSPPANDAWSKVMFLHLSHSVHRGVCLWGGLHLGVRGSACREGLPPVGGSPPPPLDTTGYGQRASGTHPTIMHSCFKSIFHLPGCQV